MRILIDFDSRMAMIYFSISFLSGLSFIYFNYYLPWSAIIVVCLYGLLLLYTSVKYRILHSQSTINTLYYLGFLLTLCSLAVAFSNFDVETVHFNEMVQKFGVAVWTTIAGLTFRQLLISMSFSEKIEDEFYNKLQDQLRKNAADYHSSQNELLLLIKEFTEARKAMFIEEEKISRKYLKAISDSSDLLEKSYEKYTPIVGNNIDAISKLSEKLNKQVREIENSIDRIEMNSLGDDFISLKRQIAGCVDEFKSMSSSQSFVSQNNERIAEELNNYIEDLKSAISSFVQETNSVSAIIKKDLENIDSILSTFIEIIKERLVNMRNE